MVKQKRKPFVMTAVLALMVTVAFIVISMMVFANVIASGNVDIAAAQWAGPIAIFLGLLFGNILLIGVTGEKSMIKLAILPGALFAIMLLGHILFTEGEFCITWQVAIAYILPVSVAFFGVGKRKGKVHLRR